MWLPTVSLVHIVTQWSGSGGTEAYLSSQLGFLQCFDAVGWVIWPVKIVPKMTYKVSSGTLNLCSLTHFILYMHIIPYCKGGPNCGSSFAISAETGSKLLAWFWWEALKRVSVSADSDEWFRRLMTETELMLVVLFAFCRP